MKALLVLILISLFGCAGSKISNREIQSKPQSSENVAECMNMFIKAWNDESASKTNDGIEFQCKKMPSIALDHFKFYQHKINGQMVYGFSFSDGKKKPYTFAINEHYKGFFSCTVSDKMFLMSYDATPDLDQSTNNFNISMKYYGPKIRSFDISGIDDQKNEIKAPEANTKYLYCRKP